VIFFRFLFAVCGFCFVVLFSVLVVCFFTFWICVVCLSFVCAVFFFFCFCFVFVCLASVGERSVILFQRWCWKEVLSVVQTSGFFLFWIFCLCDL
jgi:hypothetical protein